MQAIRSIHLFGILLMGILLYGLLACNKTLQNPQTFPVHPAAAFDSLHDLRHMMDSLPNSGLFLLALQRTGYDTLLRRKDSVYTLLVPTDNFLISQGYTKDVIANQNPALLLTGIIVPQFLYGNFSDSLLDAAQGYVGATSIIDQSTQTQVSYQLGKQAGPAGGLWIWGTQVSARANGLRASNGYLYSVDTIYQRSLTNAWLYLQSKPEFTYFVAACRINDSIYKALHSGYRSAGYFAIKDSDFFDSERSYVSNSNATYFVPTNQAFIDAGFNTIADIRAFGRTAKRDPLNATVSPLDTILYSHAMEDTALLWYDLQENPGFNARPLASAVSRYDNTVFESVLYGISYRVNTYPYAYTGHYAHEYPYIGELTFQAIGGNVSVATNSTKNPPPATLVEKDIVCAHNIILHGVDHLLWPY